MGGQIREFVLLLVARLVARRPAVPAWMREAPVVRHPRYRAWERRHVLVAVRAGTVVLALVLVVDSVMLFGDAPQLSLVNGAGAAATLLVLLSVRRGGPLRRTPAVGAWALGVIAVATTLVPIATIPAVAAVMIAYMPIIVVASALFIPWNAYRHVPFVLTVVGVVAAFAASPFAATLSLSGRGELVSVTLSAAIVSVGGHAILQRERRRAFLERLQLRSANETARRQRRQLEALAAQLEQVARRDPLTGVGNRIRLDEDVATIRRSIAASPEPTAVILFDIDHFKDYNDRNGHLAGDEVLREVARTIALNLRPGDQVYRFGGEEFLVLLTGADVAAAMVVAERLRAAVQALELPSPTNQPWGVVTVSAGVADAGGGRSDEWIRTADGRMYAAKAAGRNTVVGPEPTRPRTTEARTSAA